jgi:transposase-like protein
MDDGLARSIRGNLFAHVVPTSTLYTDEASHYTGLKMMLTYKDHHRIAHYTKVYVDGDVHTQTIDGFFAGIKNTIRGVHHGVSRRHLQGYLNEHAFRYNNRDSETPMFWLILDRVRKDRLAAA